MDNKIFDLISSHKSAPFLFVGSGFSRRYLGLEDWAGLLSYFAKMNSVDYEYYNSSANGDLPKIASLIAKDLHERWWRLPEFEKSRSKYKQFNVSSQSALKIEVSHYLKSKTDIKQIKPELIEEIELCKQIVIDGIITTNYDNLLEKLFSDFKTYIGQDELLFSSPQGMGEIYKIHGCQSKPNSLVLTDQDYESFEKKNPYLAAKLLTIFTEHPIIFIGYSLSDRNILKIINSIALCLNSDNLNKLQNRLIFIQYKKDVNEIDISTHTISHEDIRIPVQTITLNDFRPLYIALCKIKRKFPAGLLRALKEHVYDLILSSDNSSKLYVQNIDVQSISNLDVVLGVGAINKIQKTGYRAYQRDDLINDLLIGDDLDSNQIVEVSFPELLKSTKYLPFFKYFINSSYYESNKEKIDIDKRVKEHFNKANKISFYEPTSKSDKKKKEAIFQNKISIIDFVDKNGGFESIKFLPYLDMNIINSDDLLEVIIKYKYKLESNNANEKNIIYKIICFYDYVKYYLNK